MKRLPSSQIAWALSVSVAAAVAAAIVPLAPAQAQDNPPARQQAQPRRVNALPAAPKSKPQTAKLDRIAGKLTVAPAVAHENLSVYLIEGEDLAETEKILTLTEALETKGKVVVKETSDVNELNVLSKAKGQTVFIMAGDIVKGGKQDRTLGTDLPLETRAGEVPVSAFCVEQGRWQNRGGEDVATFSASANAVATREAKVAVRKAKDQSEVWRSVSIAQEKISSNVGRSVAAAKSPTSLQLSFEDKELKKQNAARLAVLMPIVEKNERSIGFVTVINGRINSAEIFAGHDLFRRAWPKLAEAAATEAISEMKEKSAKKPATLDEVKDFLATSEDAKATKEKIHGSLWNVSAESDTALLFQTVDESKDGRWLRRCIIRK